MLTLALTVFLRLRSPRKFPAYASIFACTLTFALAVRFSAYAPRECPRRLESQIVADYHKTLCFMVIGNYHHRGNLNTSPHKKLKDIRTVK